MRQYSSHKNSLQAFVTEIKQGKEKLSTSILNREHDRDNN